MEEPIPTSKKMIAKIGKYLVLFTGILSLKI